MLSQFIGSTMGRLRAASLLDGVSYLVLTGIAMPMKYMGGINEAVKYPGWIHGFLFILFCLALLIAWLTQKLPFRWCVITFLCALIPLAPFILDRKLRQF